MMVTGERKRTIDKTTRSTSLIIPDSARISADALVISKTDAMFNEKAINPFKTKREEKWKDSNFSKSNFGSSKMRNGMNIHTQDIGAM